MRFRARQLTIEAFRFMEQHKTTHQIDVPVWAASVIRSVGKTGLAVYDKLHNTMVAFKPGDWLILGIEGEVYPCVDSVFRRKYEAVR